MPVDVEGAMRAGYSKAEIAEEMARRTNFNLAGARQAGYSEDDAIAAMSEKLGKGAAEAPADEKPRGRDLAGAMLAMSGAEVGASADTLEQNRRDTTAVLKAVVPGSVQRGFARTAEGAANTAEVLGAPVAADAARRLVDKEQLNAPSSQDAMADAYRRGSVGGVLRNLPGAVGEGIPQLAGTLATSALGGAVGGAVGNAPGAVAGAFAGPALVGVVTQAGDIAKARAQADGRTEVNDEDIAVALGSSVVLGALDRIGLGKAAGGMIANAVKSSLGRGAAGRIATAAGNAAIHAGADATQAAGQNLAVTAGTETGATLDPAQIATAATTGAATRGALGAVRRAGDHLDGTASAERAAARTEDLSRRWDAMDPEDQQRARTAAGAGQAVQQVLDAQTGAGPGSYTRAARTAQDGTLSDLGRLTAGLAEQGRLTPEGQTAIRDATGAARSPHKVLTDDHLEAVRGIGLDADTTGRIEAALREVDALSRAGDAAGRGPLETAGGWAGHAAGAKAAGTLGASVLLYPLLGRGGEAAGAALGRSLDKAFGLSKPTLVREATRAVDLMTAAGEAVPNTRAELQDSIGRQRDALADLDSQMGLKRNAEDVAADRTKADRQKARQDATEAKRQGDADAAYAQAEQQRQAAHDAAFRDMEGTRRIEVQGEREQARRVAISTREQVAAFIADQAQRVKDADATAAAREQAAAQGDRMAVPADRAAEGITAVADRAGLKLDTLEARAANRAAIRQQAQGGAGKPIQAPAASGGGAGAGQGTKPASDSPGGSGESMGGDMARYARRLPEWAYGMVRSAHDDLGRAGMAKNLDYRSEAHWAIDEATKRGWFDGGEVSAERRAAALKAHDGRFAGPIFNALRNLILERHGVNRLAE